MARVMGNASKVLDHVRRHMERQGAGCTWSQLTDGRGFPPGLLAMLLEAGWLQQRDGRYVPGPGPQGVTVRQLTPEEWERVRRGEPSVGTGE